MSESGKITGSHRARAAVIYIRQSTWPSWSTAPSPPRGNTTWSTALSRWAGTAAASWWWMPIWACPGRSSPGAAGSSSSSRTSRWARSGSSWRWRSPGWPGTTPHGIDRWIWPAPATSLRIPSAPVQVCTTARGNTEQITSGSPVRPSQQQIRTSRSPRLRRSASTLAQNLTRRRRFTARG